MNTVTHEPKKTLLGLVLSAALALLPLAVPAAPETLSDGRINAAVEREIITDPGVRFNDVTVVTNDGVVTLTGATDNLQERERAEGIATMVKGVRGVINRIEVEPVERSDTSIRNDVRLALLSDPATEALEIDISVDEALVQLSGEVDSWQERELASQVGSTVRGVRAIDNQLTVQTTEARADRDIKADVQRALRWDRHVDSALIDVTVSEGTVRLSGTVGSAAEAARAEAKAWVNGVEAVVSEGLEIEPWARDENLRKTVVDYMDDAAVAAAVEDALRFDPRVDADAVAASVDAGTVTLTGTADSLKAKRAASADARNTTGVWRVKNHLKVRPETTVESRALTDNVREALLRDPQVNRFDIDVRAFQGTVYLEGQVDSYYEKAKAEEIASRVQGTVAVRNGLEVGGGVAPLTYDPYLDDFYTFDYDWSSRRTHAQPLKSDWEIQADIRDQLWWSPFVDAAQVTVTVDNGVARLTGEVDSWHDRQVAAENALEGGAVQVVNNLAVKQGPASG